MSAPYLLNRLNDFHSTSLECSSHSESMAHLCKLKVKSCNSAAWDMPGFQTAVLFLQILKLEENSRTK